MSDGTEPNCLKIIDIEPEELLLREHSELDISTLGSYDLVPISRLLSFDDVWLIKKVRSEGNKVYLPNKERKYVELRGGEWELALTFVGASIKVIVLGLITRWIYDKVNNWKQAKAEKPGSGIKQPGVKIRLYFTKSKKYIEVEGDAEAALKALDKLKKDDF